MESLGDRPFEPNPLPTQRRTLFTADTTLVHFVIVTYAVDPQALRAHLHPRFEPDLIHEGGEVARALISVVTFFDTDFRFAAMPFIRSDFGQTNYRAYVTDTETGEQVAWFFGTCLDSLTVAVPRYLWRLPWHRGRMTFDCRYDAVAKRYSHLRVTTDSRWAPARLEVEDTGEPPRALDGFADFDEGMSLLTRPSRGFYFRRDGALGSYAIWHDRICPTLGRLEVAEYDLLDELSLVPKGDLQQVHSVFIQPSIDFTIYLPPRRVRGRG